MGDLIEAIDNLVFPWKAVAYEPLEVRNSKTYEDYSYMLTDPDPKTGEVFVIYYINEQWSEPVLFTRPFIEVVEDKFTQATSAHAVR
jgi:hypothetical protein